MQWHEKFPAHFIRHALPSLESHEAELRSIGSGPYSFNPDEKDGPRVKVEEPLDEETINSRLLRLKGLHRDHGGDGSGQTVTHVEDPETGHVYRPDGTVTDSSRTVLAGPGGRPGNTRLAATPDLSRPVRLGATLGSERKEQLLKQDSEGVPNRANDPARVVHSPQDLAKTMSDIILSHVPGAQADPLDDK